MSPVITLESVDEIPANSRVCHYDELSEDIKEEFPSLTDSISVSVDTAIADGLQGCGLVKYTDYYEVSVG